MLVVLSHVDHSFGFATLLTDLVFPSKYSPSAKKSFPATICSYSFISLSSPVTSSNIGFKSNDVANAIVLGSQSGKNKLGFSLKRSIPAVIGCAINCNVSFS